ncbi:MAG TPA: UbiH/UbiF/VisC/COQ6 family ubiquinone biosynthesis hydroxylase [Alphaproteobacteria bacterium]
MKQNQTIGIIGGGLAGLTLSALLGQAGHDVVCLDAQPLQAQMSVEFDGRTTAISYASRQVMEQAGVWDGLSRGAEAIKTIDILDGDSDTTLQFDCNDVHAEAFGWIVDNADLRRALIRRVQSLKNVRHITGVSVQDIILGDAQARIALQDSRTIDVALAIGADGRGSILRDKMEIGTYGRDYYQSAIVCLVAHEKPHHGMAVEHFRPEGPFALLPFTDLDNTHRSALVWSVHGRDAKKWATCDEEIFNAALQERSQGRYGKIGAAGPRSFWPLTMTKAYSYIGVRSVLVAEAAHGMHPIAGQGLNMSLRDLRALTDILSDADDVGAPETLTDFQTQRRLDNIGMTAATDSLTLLFSNDILPVTALRRLGLAGVSHWPAAKQFFMRQAMGLSTASDTHGKPRQYRRSHRV